MQDERRKFKRRNLTYYSRVLDRLSGRVLGYIVDICPEGLMLIGEARIDSKKKYYLRMDLPEDISDVPFIDLEAQSVWCRPDVDENYWAMGFQLTGMQQMSVELIERMSEKYGALEP